MKCVRVVRVRELQQRGEAVMCQIVHKRKMRIRFTRHTHTLLTSVIGLICLIAGLVCEHKGVRRGLPACECSVQML